MEHYALVVDVRPARSTVTVYEHDGPDWLRLLWRDDRRYQAPPAVVTQVVCGVLVALAGHGDRAGLIGDLDELLADLW